MTFSNHRERERDGQTDSASQFCFFWKCKSTQKPCQDIAWDRSTGIEAERSSRKKCPSSSCEMTPITHLLPVHPTRDCKGVICKCERIEEEDYDDDDDEDDEKDKRAHNMTNPSFTRWFCSSKKHHGSFPYISQDLVQNSFSASESGVAKILWEKWRKAYY